MAKDDRDLLQVLESELDFLNKGGYDRSVRMPLEPTIFFQNSPICPECPCRTHNDQYLLMQFVPEAEPLSFAPCHQASCHSIGMPLFYKRFSPTQVDNEWAPPTEEASKAWLWRGIPRLKQECGGKDISVCLKTLLERDARNRPFFCHPVPTGRLTFRAAEVDPQLCSHLSA